VVIPLSFIETAQAVLEISWWHDLSGQTDKRVGRTDRKHNAFADAFGWRSIKIDVMNGAGKPTLALTLILVVHVWRESIGMWEASRQGKKHTKNVEEFYVIAGKTRSSLLRYQESTKAVKSTTW